ncbi:SGNH/GDSL hydrolase family protein [Candidatus Sumerlaeota bacterium]|nr:SGNH/GDSL hydrolase family protein [Candidatus Sumerlaeota bacterium]
MKTRVFSAIISFAVILLIAPSGHCAAAKAKAAKAKAAARKAAPNPAFAEVKDDPALPRVLLIGDSISIGYTTYTRELLRGVANVHRIPTNGGPTINGLKNLDTWLGDGKWDVIHFNWGLHDLRTMDDGKRQVPIDQYDKNLRELVSRLKKTGAKLIWASTTPVPDAKLSPPRKNAEVVAYNVAAKKIMDENGVAIDDLYSAVLPNLTTLQLPANVHFKGEGSAFLAKKVAESVTAALKQAKGK